MVDHRTTGKRVAALLAQPSKATPEEQPSKTQALHSLADIFVTMFLELPVEEQTKYHVSAIVGESFKA